MKDRRKKILAIVLIIVVLLLGAAAIFVTLKLQTAAVPTAPTSIPRAADWLGGGSCNVSFTVAAAPTTVAPTTVAPTTPPATPVLSCSAKSIYKNDSRNVAGTYYLDAVNKLTSTDTLAAGETVVYVISYKNNITGTIPSSVITDVLDNSLTFLDSDPSCTYATTNKTVTCTIGAVVAGGSSQVAIRVRVNADATPGTVSNTAAIAGGDTCTVAMAIPTATTTTTATATPAPACSRACPNQEGVTSGNLKCQGGLWRNSSCPTTDDNNCVCPTATATPAPGCSQACPNQEGTTVGSLTCQGGMWRNSSCPTTDDNNCVCPAGTNAPVETRTPAPTTVAPTETVAPTRVAVTATPTGATLPQTGSLNLPGATAFGGGLLLTILGILFAL